MCALERRDRRPLVLPRSRTRPGGVFETMARLLQERRRQGPRRDEGTRHRAPVHPLTLADTIGSRYHGGVIQSLADEATRKVWAREHVRQFGQELQRAAQKKLRLLNAAETINDLRIPPGNRLEKLAGDRDGQHSIRINDQYRICFVWTSAGPADVQIVDYH